MEVEIRRKEEVLPARARAQRGGGWEKMGEKEEEGDERVRREERE